MWKNNNKDHIELVNSIQGTIKITSQSVERLNGQIGFNENLSIPDDSFNGDQKRLNLDNS